VESYAKPTLQYRVRSTVKKEVICLLLVILMVLILSEDLDYVTPRSAAVSMGASAESLADISLAPLNPLFIQYQQGLTSSRAVTQANSTTDSAVYLHPLTSPALWTTYLCCARWISTHIWSPRPRKSCLYQRSRYLQKLLSLCNLWFSWVLPTFIRGKWFFKKTTRS